VGSLFAVILQDLLHLGKSYQRFRSKNLWPKVELPILYGVFRGQSFLPCWHFQHAKTFKMENSLLPLSLQFLTGFIGLLYKRSCRHYPSKPIIW